MSDLRFDPIFQQWVAISEIRRERPLEFLPVDQIRKQIICPFCRGNEDETPLPIAAWDLAGQPLDLPGIGRWSTRVIPNKYPTYDALRRRGIESCGPFQSTHLPGLQELVIPTPRHVCSLSELQVEELAVALQATQHRISQWRTDRAIEHAMFFKNCRHEAGASIEHSHFQLLGSPLVSPFLARRAARFAETRKATEKTPLEQLLEFELAAQVRVVSQTEDWIAVCPFASRIPFQTWLVPRQKPKPFDQVKPSWMRDLALLSQQIVSRLESLLGIPAYNWMLHQLPMQYQSDDHWFVEIVPRIAKVAGYEMGTDIWVNSVSPESAAKRLRT